MQLNVDAIKLLMKANGLNKLSDLHRFIEENAAEVPLSELSRLLSGKKKIVGSRSIGKITRAFKVISADLRVEDLFILPEYNQKRRAKKNVTRSEVHRA